jgi:hypothetical protein
MDNTENKENQEPQAVAADAPVLATVAVSQLMEDLEKTNLPPQTILGIAVNLAAQAYAKMWNNNVPVDGSDFRVGQFIVSIYPALSKAALLKIKREQRLAKKAKKEA